MKRLLKNTDLRDAFAVVGFLALAVGIGVVWWPGCLIVGGSILLSIALLGGSRRGTPR